MLNESLKDEIQEAYSTLLSSKGYKARHCQKVMIAEIARLLGDVKSEEAADICVIEAGTGTGKTIAYALAAIPVARELGKKIVIATATVALQEQIVYQDLPDILLHSGLEFSFALAKGRRRYLCLSKLDLAMQESASVNHSLALFDGEQYDYDQTDSGIYEAMLASLAKGDWDGDRDSWPAEVDSPVWARISTDHAQCTGRQCSHYENCFFYRARERIHRVDCVVTNQDLVLADLMMGGGAVLPNPEDTIYIFDEGHHLPEKAANHFSHFLSLYGTRNWLLQVPNSLKLASAEIEVIDMAAVARIEAHIETASGQLDNLSGQLQVFTEKAEPDAEGRRYRFPLGVVPADIAGVSAELRRTFEQLQAVVDTVEDAIDNHLDVSSDRDVTEHWLSVVSSIGSRVSAATGLWHNFALQDESIPYARWLNFTTGGAVEGMEIQLSATPVSVADELHERLWARCFAAVVTSATLSVGGDFSNMQRRSGIAMDNRFVTLPSPFDFSRQARLHIPGMAADPGVPDEHSDEIALLIPALLEDERGSLVLFTSWRQMLTVLDEIDDRFKKRVLAQGTLSKTELIARHRERIDNGESSCIFGLASFTEGIDLPGDYCRHVVIAKIPFAVPDDPVAATRSEWIESGGGNAFQEIMVPEAALRMVQASGRLLRTETDTGTVTVLDRRLLTRPYGRIILNAMPSYRREFE